MKKFITLITALALTFSVFAQPDESARRGGAYYQSRLSISTAANSSVWVFVDGNSYNNRDNDDEILINNIRPGYHSIKVYKQKNDRYGNGRRFNKNRQLVYEGNIYMKPQFHTDISINRFGRAFIDERQMDQAYYASYNENEQDHDGADWNNNGNYMQPMNGRSFEQFRETLKNESFDNTRTVIAKQTIATNYFSTAQVKEIVQLFSFENNKLDIAKYSYKYTVDKNNYFMLNDAFSFSGSKEELARYIQSYR